MKRIISFILFACGLASLLSTKFTGAVIGNLISYQAIPFFIGLTLIFTSLIILVTGKGLEAIVIPTGTREADLQRTTRAMFDYTPEKYVLVTGVIGRDEGGRVKKDTQQYNVYKDLRQTYNLSPKDLIIEGKSQDTLGNFLYMLKKVNQKGINKMQIATDSWQYKRFKLYEEMARKEGLIGEDFSMELLDTGKVLPSLHYAVIAYLKDKGKLSEAGTLENAEKMGRGSKKDNIKWILKGLI